MAILKDNFGYALVSAKSGKILKNINVSDIISDMKAELRKNEIFKGSYTDNITMLLFNSMFRNEVELKNWLLDILAKRDIKADFLNQELYVVQYYSSENTLDDYKDMSNDFLLHIKSKRHYYKVPLLTRGSYKNDSFDSNKLLTQKDLVNPFFAILKMGEVLSQTDTKKAVSLDNFDRKNTEIYNVYNLYNSSKKISSKSLEDVKSAIAVINTYICLHLSSFENLNIAEFIYKLSQYNDLILTMEKPATKEQLEQVKEYRSYLISIVKDIDFNELLESFEYDYTDLFKSILSFSEAWYLAVTKYEDDTDNNRYKQLSDAEKMRVISDYFINLRNKGEIDYKIVSDSNKMILRLLNYCDEFDNHALNKKDKDLGHNRTR